MEGSGDNLSTDGLRYLESAFLKLLSEEVQNRCSNFEEFYGELDNQGDRLMETGLCITSILDTLSPSVSLSVGHKSSHSLLTSSHYNNNSSSNRVS